TERVHFAFQNKLSPVQFMISFKQEQIQQKFNFNNLVLKSKTWWPHTFSCKFKSSVIKYN
ncbi:hypothetical protein KKA77_03965, partial [Patescibacteria group bacterium]|nr:hypothetical protein [Patescibacteria group bacterium]MBU1783708.1 hypothetical protein [Patescibacteria group bacterium]